MPNIMITARVKFIIILIFTSAFCFFIYEKTPATASIADRKTYLAELTSAMELQYPLNRTINIVCHGNSVPAGYFKTPFVDAFNAYPHLLHKGLKNRYPFAVINVITTGVGGEASDSGVKRFDRDVLSCHPDLVTIDYGLTDLMIGLEKAKGSWISMIKACQKKGIKVILLTPTADTRSKFDDPHELINQHARQIRKLAEEYNVGLVDSLLLFVRYVKEGGRMDDLMSQINHPNRKGHQLVADEMLRWFSSD